VADPQIQTPRDIAAPQTTAPPQVAAVTPAPAMPASLSVLQKRAAPPQAPNDAIALPGPDSRTALYDIEAHTVYLPNGIRLEAHSGLGNRLDDPRFVKDKARGPTPPNVYDLVLRGDLFHGVRAIRLNPVDDGKMFNRDGILAHPYMLGPTGQSFGCVSFKDYPEFLKAFEKGEIDRLVVVPHLDVRPTNEAHARREDGGRYTVNN
jgi:type VI secretion system (T6SS) effector TldE1-like protein